ncbi:hypothetical protein [Streptomyces cyaneofuscatus]
MRLTGRPWARAHRFVGRTGAGRSFAQAWTWHAFRYRVTHPSYL